MSEENKKKTFRVTCTGSPKEPSILRQYKRAIAGFALAPILYIIALAGIAGTVLFTGYTQILRSNVEITADNSVRNQIRMATEVIAAQSSVNNIANELVVPANAVAALNTLDAARLPRNAAGTAALTEAAIQGSALAVGGVAPQGGIRQLDPWGRYFVMCRWTGSTSAPQTGPSMSIISAGADGNLATTCDDTAPAAGSDDKLEYMTVANVLSRSANWQAQAMAGNRTGYTFGIDPNSSVLAVGVDAASVDTSKSLDIGGDSRFRGNLLVNQGLTVNGTTALQTLTATTTTLGATTLTTLSASTVNSSGAISGASLNVSGTSTLADVTGGAASFTSTAGGAISGSTLNLSGLATLGSGLSVTGATTLGDLTAGASTLGATMASSVSTGDLTATGTTTLASATVTGNATVGGTITAAGGFIGNLTGNVTGNVTGSAGSVDAGDITGVVPRSAGGTGVSATDMANLRLQMGLAIGTNVQAWDSDLQALADASSTGFIRRTDIGVLSIGPIMPAEVPAFAGAAPGVAGTLGGVPIAAAGQHTYLLRGDGTWFNPGSLSVGGIGQGDSGVGVTDTGVGVITFTIDGFEQARITGVASADRSVRLTGGNSGANIPPEIGAYTTAPNSPLRLASQGTGDLILRTNGIDRLTVNGATGITSGSFSGPLAGNATTATTLQTARNFSLTGDATATAVSFNGSADVALATTVAKLQGRDVAATLPNTGQALVWNGTAWAPGPAGTPDGGTLGSTTGVDVRLKDGTALLPSLTFALDTDTGIYRPANNEFGITAGGALRVLVAGDANDSVLRIQKPAGGTGAAVLRLTDAAAGADLKSVELRNQNGDFVLRALNDNGSTKADRLYVKNNGFFGLGGVTDPKQLLHLAGVLRFDADALTPCDPDATGAIRWNGTAVQWCDGATDWQSFGGGAQGASGGGALAVKSPNGTTVGYFLGTAQYPGQSFSQIFAMSTSGVVSTAGYATAASVYFTGANCSGSVVGISNPSATYYTNYGVACTGAAVCSTDLVVPSSTAAINLPYASYRTGVSSCANFNSTTPGNAMTHTTALTPAQAASIAMYAPASGYKIVPIAVGGGGGGSTVPAGNDTEIQFNDGGEWGADDQFVWDKTNDRLGIGTTPTEKLDIAAASGTSVVRLANNVGGVAIRLNANSTSNASNELVIGGAAANGNYSAVAQATDAVISAEQRDLVLTARNASGNIDFATGAADTVKMTLANNGRLGIGVPVPTQLLHLASGAVRFTADSTTACDSNAIGSIRFNGTDFEQCKSAGPWATLASGGGGGGGMQAVVVFSSTNNSTAAFTTANINSLRSRMENGEYLFATCRIGSSADARVYSSYGGTLVLESSAVIATYQDIYSTGAPALARIYIPKEDGLTWISGNSYAGAHALRGPYSSIAGMDNCSGGWKILSMAATPSTTGAPPGSDTQVPFNDGGAWSADDQFVWNKTNDVLTVGGSQLSGSGFFLAGSSDVGALGMAGSAGAANRTAINITGTASTGVITNVAVRTNNANRIVINNNGNVTIAAPSSGAALAITGDLTVSGNASPNMLVLGNNTGATCSGGTNAGAVRYNAGTFQQCNGASWATLGSGSAAAGGSNTQVQFNNSNALAGSANFTWNNGTNTLAASNLTVATAFTASGTSNFVGLISGNGKEMFNTGDTYLRINQSGAFSAGVWLANSNIAGGSGIWAMGSNGGTTNSRVYINGGTYNGTNVISLDGSNGNVALAGALTVANQINTGGALSTYGAVTINGAKGGWSGINFRSGGTNWKTLMINNSISGVYNAADNAWDYYWTGGTLTQGTIPAANVAAGTFGAGNFVFQGIVDANSQIRSPIFYDLNNGAYYVDPASTSYVNTFTGLDFRSDIWYDRNNTGYYIDGNNSSNLNVLTVNGALYTGEWVRVATSAGIYWTAYGGGWHMTDSTYLRAYNGKYVLAAGYYHTSDARMKHDIRPFRTTGLSVVDGLRTVHFKWNTDNKDDLGVIAQETEKVLPEAVHTDEKGFKQVQYDKLVLPVIEAVKELHALVKKLVTDMIDTRIEVAALKAELASQQADFTARLEALEQTCRAANDNDPAETAKQKRSSTSR